MSEEDEGSEKSHEPTPEKLKKARQEGQVAKSTDLITAAGYLGVCIVAFAMASSLETFGSALASLMDRLPAEGAALTEAANGVLALIAFKLTVGSLWPWFAVPPVLALLSVVGQRAFVVTPKNLKPKISRISILSNAKQKFGRSGLFEFAKSAVKLTIYCFILGIYLFRNTDKLIAMAAMSPAAVVQQMLQMMAGLIVLVVLVSMTIGVIDLMWQQAEHIRKNRMSRKELMDEMKNSEGDPHHKQHRRQRAQEIALNSMLADVPEASVVVVNPTHYAVALAWDRSQPAPPRCVAKGVDHVAAQIRRKAIEAGVPIHSDPPTARALHGSIDVGQHIENDHFAAVAAAIRFADDMRRRARDR